jgi:ubiquinone biosynthesis protein COQ4
MTIAVANEFSQGSFSARGPSRGPARAAVAVPPVAVPPVSVRVRRALSALAVLARDHTRLDQVLVFTQAMNHGRLARVASEIESTPEGAALFAEMPRIDRKHVDFDALRALPDGTLGREYARFLDDNGITPDAFEELPAVGDERIAFMMLRMRQSHDLWHVLTGYSPDVPGEIRLQAFTFAQTNAPSALVLTIFGTVRWTLAMKGHVGEVMRAYRRGKATKWLPTFRWEDHWEMPLDELRAMLTCPA